MAGFFLAGYRHDFAFAPRISEVWLPVRISQRVANIPEGGPA